MEDPTLEISVILLAAVGAQLLAAQLRIPAIVPLLIVGVVLGPYVVDFINPDQLLGDLLDPIVALAVGAILFDGSLSLHRKQLEHGVGGVVLRLTTLGLAITWGIAGTGAALILGLDHRIALILGAVLTLSGPTVVLPLLEFVRAKPRPDAVLRWEGILIDPIGAILGVLVFHAVVSGKGSFDVGEFVGTIGVGLAVGVVGAGLLSVLLSRRRFDAALEASATLALVLASVAIASELREDAGLVTAIVMGVMMAHRQHEIVERAPAFGGILVNLLLGTLFVILSARVDPQLVLDLGIEGLAFVALLILVARPLSVLGEHGPLAADAQGANPGGMDDAARHRRCRDCVELRGRPHRAQHPRRRAPRPGDVPGHRHDRRDLRAHGAAARGTPRRRRGRIIPVGG